MTTMNAARAREGATWFVLFGLLVWFDVLKGWRGVIQGWGLPYWYVSYGDGLVRRGLAGEMVHRLYGTVSEAILTRPVLIFHGACLVILGAIFCALAATVMARLQGRAQIVFLGLALWVFTAQGWALVSYNAGYLDSPVLLLATLAALLLWTGRPLLAAIPIAVGPLVHEFSVFLLPMALAAGLLPGTPPDRRKTVPLWGLAALGALGVGIAVAVTLLADPAATVAQINRMPLSAEMKQALIQTQFGQGVRQAFFIMLDHFGRAPLYDVGNFAFFLLPTVMACLGLLFWRARPGWRNVALALAGLAPVSVLLIAWDLSRLLTISNFSAGLLFLLAAEQRSRAPCPGVAPLKRAASGLLAAAAVLYGLLPGIYAYFPPGPVTLLYPLKVDAHPLAMAIKRPLSAAWGKPLP
ncbi:hypothetical protein J5J86_23865 [Aquabacter sp. L1I39]|uniref:hypothetical protein n=1 Tax=Aquabacter sp. L1I39 TaxID=2820278 RepID=UPI001ADB74CE|nr:hypothetical protein [Aquabacter sp. L1I39]QTL03723.1 hypothetical protein J5J86_23865 [Aquabacter sp. L1I39]